MKRHNSSSPLLRIAAAVFASFGAHLGAAPYDSATVTRVENKATVAEVKGGQIIGGHPAVLRESIKPNNVIQTANDSRAELEFADKSLVRVGPNAVFSFESRSRTLSLEKGSMLFYLPPGRGSVTVKTAAVTAAITGTVVIFDQDNCLVLDGTLTLKYMEDGVEKTITLESGTDHNAARWENGRLVTYQADGRDETWFRTRDKLLTWATLPANAEIKVAEDSPWVRYPNVPESDLGFYGGGAAGGFGIGGNVSPSFGGGGGGEIQTTTRVLADGNIGIFDAAGLLLGLQ